MSPNGHNSINNIYFNDLHFSCLYFNCLYIDYSYSTAFGNQSALSFNHGHG